MIGQGKESQLLENITMIGQLTREEGVASDAKVPDDRLISREGNKCIPQYRHRRLIGADIYTGSDSMSNIYHRRYVSQKTDTGGRRMESVQVNRNFGGDSHDDHRIHPSW